MPSKWRITSDRIIRNPRIYAAACFIRDISVEQKGPAKDMDKNTYNAYLEILREELQPAMGCTEPIAVAYAAALLREKLGRLPEKCSILVSGNIIKNVKSVIVPNTGGRKGIRTAVGAGLVFGRAEKVLEVLSEATDADIAALDRYLESAEIAVGQSESLCSFDIQITGDGIVVKGVENSIRAVSELARDGMRETDAEILNLMLREDQKTPDV